MNGGMLESCPNCHAYLIQGRPDCPFCGTTPGETPPIPAAPPPQAGFAPPRPPKRSASSLALMAVIGVVVFAGGAFLVNHGREANRERAAADTAPTTPRSPNLTKLLGVCADDPEPIPEAAPYQAGPGPHYIELMILEEVGEGFANDHHWSGLTGGAYYKTLDDAVLADLELVACFHVTESAYVTSCDMSTFGSSPQEVTMELYAGSGEMEVREAKTGRVVQTNEVPATEHPSCATFGSTGEHLLDIPDLRADAILRSTLGAGPRPT